MAQDTHNRLDLKLKSWQYVDAPCGSINLDTGQAEYCTFTCPTLIARMKAGEDVTAPLPFAPV